MTSYLSGTDCCLINLLKQLGSQSASNFGTFLIGFGTIVLGLAAVYGATTFKRWRDEKKYQKRSDIAEKTLNNLDILQPQIFEWLELWGLVYDKNSTPNRQRRANASDEQKKEIDKNYDSDLYEIHNFSKKGQQILKKIIRIKNHAWRLNNEKINQNLSAAEKIMKDAICSLNILHFVNTSPDDKATATKNLSAATDKVKELLNPIYEELRKYLLFD